MQEAAVTQTQSGWVGRCILLKEKENKSLLGVDAALTSLWFNFKTNVTPSIYCYENPSPDTQMLHQQDTKCCSFQATAPNPNDSHQHRHSFKEHLLLCTTIETNVIKSNYGDRLLYAQCEQFPAETERRALTARHTHTAPRQGQGSHAAAAVQLALLFIRQHTKGAAQSWESVCAGGRCHFIYLFQIKAV